MDPIVIAIALSLYAYNVSACDRARYLHDHFKGACMDYVELVNLLVAKGTYIATELPFPSAEVYLRQALERYGAEAARRVQIEREGL